jgi:hypothetical protein
MAAIAALAISLTAWAADVYRWVDKDGRIQLSDRVPEEYRKSATRIDTSPSELSPAQRKEAEQRAAQRKVREAEAAAREARVRAPEAAQAPVPAASTAKTTGASDCATLQRRYRENAECLAPYMTVRGAFKPGAFEACGPSLPSPEAQCGPAR